MKRLPEYFLKYVRVLLAVILVTSLLSGWGPAAFAQSEETRSARSSKTKKSAPKVTKSKAKKQKKKKKKASPRASTEIGDIDDLDETDSSEDIQEVDSEANQNADPDVDQGTDKETKQETDPDTDPDTEPDADQPESQLIRPAPNSRELAVRTVGIGKIQVRKQARKYVPRDLETRLTERLIQELSSKTYFEPEATSSPGADVDAVFVFEIGLEEIKGYLKSSKGPRRLRSFEFRYLIGELEKANAVSVLADRMIEAIVQAIPYRGFVTDVSGTKTSATVNLGSVHGVKPGDVMELFEFRQPHFNSPRRRLFDVKVTEVIGASESRVEILKGGPTGQKIQPYSKVSFSMKPNPTVESPVVQATGHSVVVGRWWFGFGGELNSFGADAAAPQYESRVFKVNGAPFGYIAAGNDQLTFRGAFGSAKSDTETLGFLDSTATYNLYQLGSAQAAWTFAAGARVFLIQVTPNPAVISALESTNVISPMAEAKYHYVPRSRIRLVGTAEVFWPIYSSGASVGALPFAFGAGVGAGLQIALTSKFGFEVSGKIRYLRRPVDGQSGIQERQSTLGGGLIFSF